MQASAAIRDAFPAALSDHLAGFRRSGGAVDVTLIRGLPLDEPPPPTPRRHRDASSAQTFVAEAVITAVASAMGTVYTLAGKANLRHIDDIFAVAGDEQKQLSSNQVFLEWHVEDGFHRARADYVALYCLRGDEGVATLLAPERLLRLSGEHRRVLREPRFRIWSDATFTEAGLGTQQAVPLLCGGEHRPELVFDVPYTECADEEARCAFMALRAEIARTHFAVSLAAGDLLLFDNRRVVHARSEYRPRPDGDNRWLKRALILRDRSRAAGFSFELGVVGQ